ncbi:hypothetical protein IC230_22070 [Spirosoma sp. BT704]|uniref:Uncharacterized protein n=1 Tax=Spirosoma validum TaxID=2771355 RepID=A0A927GFC1_9BACT|nr:hypothetical protein [Spirosoma validum]
MFFAFVGLLSCQPDERLTGVSAGASGWYLVTAYVVSGDTLFSLVSGSTDFKPGINKIGVDNFTTAIEAIESDQSVIKTSYRRNGRQSTFSKEVFVKLTNYDYQFSLKTSPPTIYEGRVGQFTGFFSERTVGGGVLIPLADSSTSPNQSSSQDVVIIAQSAN